MNWLEVARVAIEAADEHMETRSYLHDDPEQRALWREVYVARRLDDRFRDRDAK